MGRDQEQGHLQYMAVGLGACRTKETCCCCGKVQQQLLGLSLGLLSVTMALVQVHYTAPVQHVALKQDCHMIAVPALCDGRVQQQLLGRFGGFLSATTGLMQGQYWAK